MIYAHNHRYEHYIFNHSTSSYYFIKLTKHLYGAKGNLFPALKFYINFFKQQYFEIKK